MRGIGAHAMQSEKRIFDDLAKVLNGVAGTVAGFGREAEAAIKERSREWTAGGDFVSREEFDAVKQMAATARAEAEQLGKRVAQLEAAMGVKSAAPKAAAPKAAPKPAAKKAPAKKLATKK
jgi:BMFP domain-containing protein YqiC